MKDVAINEIDLVLKVNKIDKILLSRKNENKLLSYNTGEVVHLKQMEFHKNTNKNRWVFGGNRSGKTECGAVETVWLARGIHPYKENIKNSNGWVVSLSTQVQRDVAQKKILYYLNKSWIKEISMLSGKKDSPEFGVIDYIVIENVFGGTSKIGFKNCDQGREKFQGTSLNYVWFDEEPPLDIYMECKMRVLDKCGYIFGTMTPLKGLSWVYNHIYLNEFNDPDVWHITMEWDDNPFLNKAEIDKFSSVLTESELNSRKFGKFDSFGGIVYSEFNENVHVIEPFNIPSDWQDTISIDPGLHNPLSAHWYAVDYDGNVYVIAEHYEKERDIQYHADKIKKISNNLNWKKDYNGNIKALIDSAANQKTLNSNKSVVELFYEQGISVNTNVNKDIFSGIQKVKQYLKTLDGRTRLYIFKNCVNLIKEFKGYFWGNSDSPIKKDDHALDELRYYLMSKPDTPVLKEKKSIIELDKERKIRYLKNKYNGFY